MKFVDEVKVNLQAGNGGHGCISFRREKFVPRGGPDGGDGGKGGDVVFETTLRKQTLLDFRFRHLFKATSGQHGRGKNQHGRSGESLVLELPVGTVVKDPETGEIVADLNREGERWVAAKGGRGGRGNSRFVTSVRQAPRVADDGEEGELKEYLLELKLMADVGLVGFPNAGKSTLISVVSAARPKIADYPFTTLVPNLGVVQYRNAPPFVMADIPGLIEGAHEGAGLGSRFLRHIERTGILLTVIDAGELTEDDPLRPFRLLEHELASYSTEVAGKRRLIALNKIDLVPDPELLESLIAAYRTLGPPVVAISALNRDGVDDLLRLVTETLGLRDED